MNRWIIDSIKKNDNVAEMLEDKDGKYRVKRKTGKDIIVFCLEKKNVTLEDIKGIPDDIDFLVIIPKDQNIEDSAMMALNGKTYSFGRLGDLYRYINNNSDNKYWLDFDSEYILENLPNHRKVKQISRIGQYKFKITKTDNQIVNILAICEYDISKSAVELYHDADDEIGFILCKLPHAQLTQDAKEYAAQCGVPIGMRGDLMNRLN